MASPSLYKQENKQERSEFYAPRSKGVITPEVLPLDLPLLDTLQMADVALFVWSDVRPLGGVAGYLDWRFSGSLSRLFSQNLFTADLGEVLLLPAGARLQVKRLFLFGLGEVAKCTAGILQQTLTQAEEVLKKAGVTSMALAAPVAVKYPELTDLFVRIAKITLKERPLQLLVEKL